MRANKRLKAEYLTATDPLPFPTRCRARLGAEWDTPFLRGFTLTGRALYNDEVFADNANTLLVPP